MTLVGIDVSSYQPANIATLVPADFVIVKATEGIGFVSATCASQITGALGSGKRAGFYHFISLDDPVAQADFFCAQTAGFFWHAVPFLDWEGAGMGLGVDGARAFVDRVRSNMGVLPPIYMSLSPASQGQYAALTDAGLWVAYGANYDTPQGYEGAPPTSASGVWPFATLRQFTSAGQLPGYGGNLDLDVFYGDVAAWDAYARGGTAPKQTEDVDMAALAQFLDDPGQPKYMFTPNRIKHFGTDEEAAAASDATGLPIHQYHHADCQRLIWAFGDNTVSYQDVLELAIDRNPDGSVADYNKGGIWQPAATQVEIGDSLLDQLAAKIVAASPKPPTEFTITGKAAA